MYRVAYRILVASLVLCLLFVGGLSLLERTGFIEIDEKAIQPEVVSCQIGHKDMEVRVQGSSAAYRGEVVPRYEFWLPPFGGCAVYYWDRPKADQRNGTYLACLLRGVDAKFGEFTFHDVRE
jgi:hypothetical protein